MSSLEEIIPILRNTYLEEFIYQFSYPNSLVFNLSVGYLSGVFIYYLTSYIPNQNRIKQQRKITHKLIFQVHSRINNLFRTILMAANFKDFDLQNAKEDQIKEICERCNLNEPTGGKKEVIKNPYLLGDILVRESLVNDWNFILNHLIEVDSASIYIDPEIYDLCLQIKKCSLPYSIYELTNNERLTNKNLGNWHSGFYDLNKLNQKLKNLEESIRLAK